MSRGSLFSDVLRHFVRTPRVLVAFFVILAMFLSGFLFASFIAPQNPYELGSANLGDALCPPLWATGGKYPYVLGTDSQGRDVASMIVYGLRVALTIGICTTLVASAVGSILGIIAGYLGGFLDTLIMRTGDMTFAFPSLVLAMFILGATHLRGVGIVILILSVTRWLFYARTARAKTLVEKQREYCIAAKSIGATGARIVLRHLTPNVLTPLIAIAIVDFGMIIITAAGLSYLGVGIPINTPSLGGMLASARNYVIAGKWWLIVFPGMTLVALVLCINVLGDWLSIELNPKLRGK